METKTATHPSAESQIFVRMYRALGAEGKAYAGYLGDCFLIRVVNSDGSAEHILIDFGILMGSAQAEVRMQQIAADIVRATGGEIDNEGNITQRGTLDLLVVTHEHWDHISGFSQAQEIIFGGLDIKQLWMAWTEDDKDDVANQLRQEREKRSTALAALSETIQKAALSASSSPFSADVQTTLSGLDAFLGPMITRQDNDFVEDALGVKQRKPRRLQGHEIMKKVKAEAGESRFLSPGQVVFAPGALRTFVLGPPRNITRLKQDKPSRAGNETWFGNPALEDLLFRLVDDEPLDPDCDLPFASRSHRIRSEDVRAAESVPPPLYVNTNESVLGWLNQHYYAEADSDGCDQTRRTIDADWLGAAGGLALKLDSDTNNTSLVLAFELPDRTFMLFPGDAQVGNWLSWHDQSYPDGDKQLTATDILGRVRFYKVGHHGSHNATVKAQGLELMTHAELVAAIPTDEAFGKQQGTKGWQMPNPLLKEAVLAATKGRLFRNDDSADADYTAFNHRLKATELYLEFTVF